MYCSKCGHEKTDDGSFCAYCGIEVEADVPEDNVKALQIVSHDPVYVFNSRNVTLTVFDNCIVIRRVKNSLFTGDSEVGKTILYDVLETIYLKKAGLTDGYIQFKEIGGKDGELGWLEMESDENTVTFPNVDNNNHDVEIIKEYVRNAIRKIEANGSMDRQMYKQEVKYKREDLELKRSAVALEKQRTVTCKKCGSTALVGNKKGYGIGKGMFGLLVGIFLIGPFGLLGLMLGNFGAKKVWVTCLKCGKKYKA